MIFADLPVPAPSGLLPQNEKTAEDAEKRTTNLAAIRDEYELTSSLALPINANESILFDIPFLKKVPLREAFSSAYEVGRGVKTAPMVANQDMVSKLSKDPFGPFGAYGTPGVPPLSPPFTPPFSLSDYEDLFITIETPAVVKNWMTDARFAEQRLSGVNPGAIKKLDAANPPGTLNLDQFKEALGESLSDYAASRKLYFVDHGETLKNVEDGAITIPIPGQEFTIQKYLPKSIALFEWQEDGGDVRHQNGKLVPVAIQIDAATPQGVKVFTPPTVKPSEEWNPSKDGDLIWTIAKICFSVTDANAHEMHTHLGTHHFAQEAFGAITPRQLAPNHPLFLLLKPHLRFLVWNNQIGVEQLVQPSGPVDILLAGNLKSSLDITIDTTKNWSLANTFITDLDSRGVNNNEELPHYPYRDDGKLIWQATKDFVSEYLALYYKTTADITDDFELQNWAAELVSTADDGGRINGMPGTISTLEELVDIATMIIFTNSAGHSSINFPQYPYMGFNPNMPLAGYADHKAFLAAAEQTNETQQMQFIQSFLPRQFTAAIQTSTTFALSAFHFDELGDYGDTLGDVLAKQVLYEFRQNLQDIEQRISARNARRFVPYSYLLPSEILNSASI